MADDECVCEVVTHCWPPVLLDDMPFSLNVKEHGALEAFMHERGWLPKEVTISHCTVPGNGNMNAVVRIFPSRGKTSIVKQAPPFCYAFPSIAASSDRSLVERE